MFPAVNVLLSKWAPMTEKYHLSSIVFSGVHFGMMITFPLSGHLASSAYGWSSVFYTTGFVTLIWVVCWCFMGANSPAEHLSITKAEREYIVNSLKSTTSKKVSSHQRKFNLFTRVSPTYFQVKSFAYV